MWKRGPKEVEERGGRGGGGRGNYYPGLVSNNMMDSNRCGSWDMECWLRALDLGNILMWIRFFRIGIELEWDDYRHRNHNWCRQFWRWSIRSGSSRHRCRKPLAAHLKRPWLMQVNQLNLIIKFTDVNSCRPLTSVVSKTKLTAENNGKEGEGRRRGEGGGMWRDETNLIMAVDVNSALIPGVDGCVRPCRVHRGADQEQVARVISSVDFEAKNGRAEVLSQLRTHQLGPHCRDFRSGHRFQHVYLRSDRINLLIFSDLTYFVTSAFQHRQLFKIHRFIHL